MTQTGEPPAAATHGRRRAIPAAKTRVGVGHVTYIGATLALLVIALAVVLAHDTLVSAGALTGSHWVDRSVDALNGLRAATWVLPVSVLLILAGLWLLVAALRPRPPAALAVRADTGVFLRPRAVKRLVKHTAENVDGVIATKVSASRRRVDVRAEVTSTEATGADVQTAVEQRLQPLQPTPKMRVKTTTAGGPR